MLTKSSISLSKDKKKITITLLFDEQLSSLFSNSIIETIMRALVSPLQTFCAYSYSYLPRYDINNELKEEDNETN